jgi:hypothetical protein
MFTREERLVLGMRRILKNLDALTVANMRTLEMKVSDSGPNQLRVDPHLLQESRNRLVDLGTIRRVAKGSDFFQRSNADPITVVKRIDEIQPIYEKTKNGNFTRRVGQALEIAIQKALQDKKIMYLGHYPNLAAHDDSKIYDKEEPPSTVSGLSIAGKKKLDFIAMHPSAGPIGIEAKNIREWLYPNRTEIKELLYKAISLDAVPCLIGRRIPYVTYRLLTAAGVILFQNYNQLYPQSEAELASKAKNKKDLGYHDIRLGNEPSDMLLKFFGNTISEGALHYRDRFEKHKDLLAGFASGDISYPSFAARVRRREKGQPEKSDWQIALDDEVLLEDDPDTFFIK